MIRHRHSLSQSTSTMAAMVVLLLLGLLQLAVPGLAQSPPSGMVKIDSFTYSGSGCPPGSSGGVVSSDATTFTVVFDKYTAFSPESAADRRKNCQLSIGLTYPAGFVFTLESVTFRGNSKGGEGSLAASYYFPGIPETVRLQRKLPPPTEGNFELTEKFLTFIYSPCGTESVKLYINFEARVRGGSITVASVDFRLLWKKC
ncbi:hypothetical protein CBR_g31821 [Chara braunii]|uniref:DUF4360 domain-containing protein n=1 Tax=Chara braunii TaxID=69332 RepID=A0A388LFR0_CHABU|nr:hypothetical protein CBR_g31821 [Chara braunii]|eukprot:GBG81145.1 hypothetical protein CBR_g31821 [Chara braunii]